MKIAIASDHRGFRLKQKLKPYLEKIGYEIKDFGCAGEESVDYPDYALLVAESVRKGKSARGILICATGIGMSIVANKVPGIRAALVCNEGAARFAAQHNNANIMCLAGAASLTQVKKFIKIWLTTPFAWERHLRRLNKIGEIEKKYLKP